MQTTLPTLDEIEQTIGGRPTKEKKVRLTFYLSKAESEKLRKIAQEKDNSVSIVVRELIRSII